jgi:dTDP-4-dehydrorhamnose reductase
VKVLVLGAQGQVGDNFVRSDELARCYDTVFATRDGRLLDGRPCESVDLTSTNALTELLDRVAPRLIINAAAYTKVDQAEREEAVATAVNARAVGTLGGWAARNQARVVHYSTDYVFDGTARSPYPVDAETGPLNAYGRSKLAGERALCLSGADHLVLRTAWVYGSRGHNFFQTMLRLGRERDELRIVADQQGCPTPTSLIVAGTLAALDNWPAAAPESETDLRRTHHLVCSGTTSWFDFAQAIFKQAQERGILSKIPHLVPIGSKDYPTPAVRPAWSVLDNSGFSEHFGFKLPDWRVCLQEVFDELST